MPEKIQAHPETSRESLEKAIPDIKALLIRSYQEQQNNTYTLDQSFEKRNGLCQSISTILKGKGISVEPTTSAIMTLFLKNNISLVLSPIEIAPGQYQVNHPMYAFSKGETYDMSRIRFDGFPVRKIGVSTQNVQEIIIPDIRESRGTSYDGMTIENPQTKESSVLLFPDRIKQNAEKAQLSVRDYKDIVATNEVSQVYFSKLIPIVHHNKRIAEDYGIQAPPHTTIQHLKEAFSDLCSLKFGKGGKDEMLRILTSTDHSYILSRLILRANLQLRFPTFKPEAIPNKIRSMSPEEFQQTKTYIIEGYEANILPVIKKLQVLTQTKS